MKPLKSFLKMSRHANTTETKYNTNNRKIGIIYH